MTAEAGHHAERIYVDQEGDLHLNGASFFNDAEDDISASLEVLNTLAPGELGFLDGVTAGTALASKALVLDASKDIATIRNITLNGNLTYSGATTVNKLTLPTNLADALSVLDSAGDLVVFDTTTGTQVVTITPAVTITGALTANGGVTLADATNVAVNASTGTKIGTGVTQKLGFWNATPIVQPAGAGQAAVAAPTSYTAHGAGGTAVTSAAATDLDTTAAALATAVTELTALRTLVDAMRTALVNSGIMKGSA